MSRRGRWLTAIVLLIIIAAVAAPSRAYRENQRETDMQSSPYFHPLAVVS